MKKQFQYPDLPKLSVYRYENFFNIYEDENKNRFYNLLRSINLLPANESSLEFEYVTKPNDTWYYISYKNYNTMDLWWLVCEYNQIRNPTILPETGTVLKILRKEVVGPVISELNRQIKR